MSNFSNEKKLIIKNNIIIYKFNDEIIQIFLIFLPNIFLYLRIKILRNYLKKKMNANFFKNKLKIKNFNKNLRLFIEYKKQKINE